MDGKRKRSQSRDESDDSESTCGSSSKRSRHKSKKKSHCHKTHKKHKEKHLDSHHKSKKTKKKKRKSKKSSDDDCGPKLNIATSTLTSESSSSIKQSETRRCAMTPMTKEEYEKQQSVVRRVLDPETGRNRLVRGGGEIIEEIVSKQRHRQINKQATAADGLSYQMKSNIKDT